MVGGSANFTSATQNNGVDTKSFEISPNIGYFIIDKLAIGIIPSYSYTKISYVGGYSIAKQLNLGPFIRYYFLNTEKLVNVFAQTTYQYQHAFVKGGVGVNGNAFTITGGATVFFNSSVGLEFTVNYETLSSSNTINTKYFVLGIGFQIYLKKEKD